MSEKKVEKITSPAGNRTPVSRVTGGDTHHYTTEEFGNVWCENMVYKTQALTMAKVYTMKIMYIYRIKYIFPIYFMKYNFTVNFNAIIKTRVLFLLQIQIYTNFIKLFIVWISDSSNSI